MATQLFSQHDQGYSWSNDHTYYECTQEEYDELEAKYKDYDNYETYYDSFFGREMKCEKSTQVAFGTICTNPTTIVSDGYAVRGGRKFKAYGITIKHKMGVSTDCSSYRHYIKPGSIVRNEQEKHEEWWV